ncbi:MAG TPA: hypothetical protein VFZ48_00070 [Candidatus Saccharimonadales bacterium]
MGKRKEEFPLDIVLTVLHGPLFPVAPDKLVDLIEFLLKRQVENEADGAEMERAREQASPILKRQLSQLFRATTPPRVEGKALQAWLVRLQQKHGATVTVQKP